MSLGRNRESKAAQCVLCIPETGPRAQGIPAKLRPMEKWKEERHDKSQMGV
jgi:hypothetical protein